MNDRPKQRWGCLQWGVVAGVVTLAGLWLNSQFAMAARTAAQIKAVRNCTQVILALKRFAADNGSRYPDSPAADFIPVSSNQIFRRLFKEQVWNDERVFGCPGSKYSPDGNIGSAPGFAQALEPGECHWMLLSEQSDESYGDVPIIIENALDTSVPPRWDLAPASPAQRGRAWKNGKIVIGMNDGSAQMLPLRSDGVLRGNYRPPEPEGRNYFDTLSAEQRAKLKYWDIEERK